MTIGMLSASPATGLASQHKAQQEALVDAGVEFDLGRLAGWARTRAFVGVQAFDGRPGGALAGEGQVGSAAQAIEQRIFAVAVQMAKVRHGVPQMSNA